VLVSDRYYFQRYEYFSKFDEGVLMDKGTRERTMKIETNKMVRGLVFRDT
jgi:hypothetical protein